MCCVRSRIHLFSIWSSSGCSGKVVVFCFFSEKLKSSVPASGSQQFRDQLTQRMIQSNQSVVVEDFSVLSEACDFLSLSDLKWWYYCRWALVLLPWGMWDIIVWWKWSWHFCEDQGTVVLLRKTAGLGASGLEASQCPMNTYSCLLRFFPRICQYLLIESQMTDVVIKFLHESDYMCILQIQGFFI